MACVRSVLLNELKFVKEKLKSWNIEVFSDLEIQKILDKLDDLSKRTSAGDLFDELSSNQASLKNELDRILLREETSWRQKTRLKWVKEGDIGLQVEGEMFHQGDGELMQEKKEKQQGK